MDKRTIFALIALTVVLIGVNRWFDYMDQGRIQEWNAQQVVKKSQKKKLLEKEIEQRSVQTSELPLVAIYKDPQGTEFITEGVLAGNSILSLAWESELPETVYVKSEEYSSVKPATRQFKGHNGKAPVIYTLGKDEPMPSVDLPDFGQYTLQLVSPLPRPSSQRFEILVGDYTDGHFNLLQGQLDKLEKDLQTEHPMEPRILHSSIALFKTEKGYLPVAIYDAETKSLIDLEDYEGMEKFLSKPEKKADVPVEQKGEEKFYVLENAFQQLVFSNHGGALVEINLPFRDKNNQSSVVREIEFDREMIERAPYNAYFPARPYYLPGKEKGEFEEQKQGKLGGYYPLIRRDLIENAQGKIDRIPPRLYALNIVSEYPEVAELIYEVKQFDDNTLVFEARQGHRIITKTYSLAPEDKGAPYTLDLTIKVEGDSRGLWLNSGVPEAEWISGGAAPSLKYRITRNQKPEVNPIDLPSDATTMTTVTPDWICNSNGFFGMIMDPLDEVGAGLRAQYVSGATAPSRLLDLESINSNFTAKNLPGYQVLLPLKPTPGTMKFRFFAGPFSDGILKQVDSFYTNAETGYTPDYIACQTFHGWFSFISEPFAKFLFILMNFFHRLTGSWGFSIILLTVALRIMMYPLNAWSSKSMIMMQKVAPEVTAIQEKYKKDPKKAQTEIMNLYRERGVNPLTGCLPMLIQMPFLIGMFDLLKSTFELRGASFIPGWIDDLAAPDVLFSWTTPIFFIGNQFHLLPILLGLVMFVQQRYMSTTPTDAAQMNDQQRQQRAMGNMMTVVFTVMFYNFPSGLNIYWLSSMVLGILQQWWTQKQLSKKLPETKKT
jgi:YidC/Oxa1 family membrane protein insertase